MLLAGCWGPPGRGLPWLAVDRRPTGGNSGGPLVNAKAARAGAGMGLLFGSRHRDRRQLDGLKPLRLRVVGPRRARQRGLAARALVRHEMLGARNALGRQQLFQMRRMMGLAAAPAFGFLLFDRLIRAQ